MKTFVFLGAYSEVLGAGIKLTRFGQRVDLPPEIAEDTKHPRGLPCIPAESFDTLGFTVDELRKFGVADTHDRAPAEFLGKKATALEILNGIRVAAKQPKAEPDTNTEEVTHA
jgi:hypothetical protein